MIKLNSCTICAKPILDEQPIFHFPKLPEWHDLSMLHGMVHVDCLCNLPNREYVSRTLADICESFYGKDSETPVVAREHNLIIKDCRRDSACFDVYDFDDFAEFYSCAYTRSGTETDARRCLVIGGARTSDTSSCCRWDIKSRKNQASFYCKIA